LERSWEKWGIITKSQGGEEYPTYNKNKLTNSMEQSPSWEAKMS
jgi:hypothetical protein